MIARFKSKAKSLAAGCLALVCCTQPAAADSLWKPGVSKSMFSDKKAGAVGDLLTVLVQESNTASKDGSTKTAKKSSSQFNMSLPMVGNVMGSNGLSWGSAREFEGTGGISSKESIVGKITVRVVDVLPNGSLIVEGTRQAILSNESQDIIVRGVVRGADITPANTVYSYNLADVTIKYVSRGIVADSQKRGWLDRGVDKIAPF